MSLNAPYVVQQGEESGDVAINATGSYANLDAILTANSFTDWNPTLVAGQVIIIPDIAVIDQNTLADKVIYPRANGWTQSIEQLLDEVFDAINDNWILANGFWNDQAIWIDTDVWNDTPPA